MAQKKAPKRKTVVKKARRTGKSASAASRTRTAVRAKAASKGRKQARMLGKLIKKIKRVAKAAPKRPIAGMSAAAKRSAKALAKKSGATLRATKAAATRAANKARKKATQRVAGRKADATKLKKRVASNRGSSPAAAKKAPAAVAAAPARTRAKAQPQPLPLPQKPVSAPASARKRPSLDRERRVVRESDLPPSPPSSLVPQRHASAASTGAEELRAKLASHGSAGRELLAGDVDADWQTAETSGDGAPGGDNPTPDQDVVEEIGRALGVQYDDDEELRGGDEIADRDHDRWELDPASSEDFEDR